MKKNITGIILCFLLSATFVVAQDKVNITPIIHLLLGSSGSFTISSSSFTNNQPLSLKYTLYGDNISPQLAWENAPSGTESFDLTVIDPDVGNFIHWKVQLPKTTTALSENAGDSGGGNLPNGSIRYNNDFFGSPFTDGTDYDGPRPPSGSGVHYYNFILSALDASDTLIESVTITGTVFIDCNGDIDGTAYLDNCGICVGGNTGEAACPLDCNGDWGGTAYVDNCSICVGGNTGEIACILDCNGDWAGTAYLDGCAICVGGNTGEIACIYPATMQYCLDEGRFWYNDGCNELPYEGLITGKTFLISDGKTSGISSLDGFADFQGVATKENVSPEPDITENGTVHSASSISPIQNIIFPTLYRTTTQFNFGTVFSNTGSSDFGFDSSEDMRLYIGQGEYFYNEPQGIVVSPSQYSVGKAWNYTEYMEISDSDKPYMIEAYFEVLLKETIYVSGLENSFEVYKLKYDIRIFSKEGPDYLPVAVQRGYSWVYPKIGSVKEETFMCDVDSMEDNCLEPPYIKMNYELTEISEELNQFPFQ